jgi:hypothetical protein
MRRVLRPGGRLGVAVWGPFERATSYVTLSAILEPLAGASAVGVLTAPHSLGSAERLHALVGEAGFVDVAAGLHEGSMTYPSIAKFIETEVKGSPLEGFLPGDAYQRLVREAEAALAHFVQPDGRVVMPMDAFIVTASRG